MKLLWFTWKDRRHPHSGGAEAVNEEIAKRLVAAGHEVIFVTGGCTGAPAEETVDGYRVIRLGNRWSVYWRAYRYYKKHLQSWADLVIDEINTVPFLCKLYVKEPNIILAFQLCRQIWFYQLFFPLNLIGYLLEPIYLWLLHDRFVLTESESTKADLQRYGFAAEKIFVFPIGLENTPITAAEFDAAVKEPQPTILYFGSMRRMKRPHQIVEAFRLAKQQLPGLRLWLAGGGEQKYIDAMLKQGQQFLASGELTYFGRVDQAKKLELMRRAQLIAAASVKEGWGIVITEAASQGTPAVVYDADGLRDSCVDRVTGRVAANGSPRALAAAILAVLQNKELYVRLRRNAWQRSADYTYDRAADIFKKYLEKISYE